MLRNMRCKALSRMLRSLWEDDLATGEIVKRRAGKYSKYAPARLLERYEAALTDPEYGSLRDSVALVDARISELLEAYGEGSSTEIWSQLIDSWMDFTRAISNGDTTRQTILLGHIDQLIRQGSTIEKTWNDIGNALEARRKLVDTDMRNRVAASQNITVEQALALVSMMLEVMKESAYKYADEEVAKRILYDTGSAYQRAISLGQSESARSEYAAIR